MDQFKPSIKIWFNNRDQKMTENEAKIEMIKKGQQEKRVENDRNRSLSKSTSSKV